MGLQGAAQQQLRAAPAASRSSQARPLAALQRLGEAPALQQQQRQQQQRLQRAAPPRLQWRRQRGTALTTRAAMFDGLSRSLEKAWDTVRKDGKLTAENIKEPMREIR